MSMSTVHTHIYIAHSLTHGRFHDNPAKPIPEHHHSGFYQSNDDVLLTTGAIRRAKLQSNHHGHKTIAYDSA